MDKNEPHQEQELRFFATAPRPCSYLQDRNAISVFADPEARLSSALYNQLARYGFRRSGNDLYVPACPGCSACIPVRVPVTQFIRSRNQRRIWNRNRDLECTILPAEYRDEHFELYARYQKARHPGGGMDNPTADEYIRFLTCDWSDTQFIEFRIDRKTVAVAVTDRLCNALSAVYTFFDPVMQRRSLGTYAILRQIEMTRKSGCDWLYLGYWIQGSRKMDYKSRFRPIQAFRNGHWQLTDLSTMG